MCVGVCARVRAVRRTQGLTNNVEAMRTEASRADNQGQTLLHIIAWRNGRSPNSRRPCPERSSPIQIVAPRSCFAFLPSLHHETPGLSAASRSRLTRPFSPTRLRPLSCSLRKFVKGLQPVFFRKGPGKQRSKFPNAGRLWRPGSVQRENPEGVEGGVVRLSKAKCMGRRDAQTRCRGSVGDGQAQLQEYDAAHVSMCPRVPGAKKASTVTVCFENIVRT